MRKERQENLSEFRLIQRYEKEIRKCGIFQTQRCIF